MRKLITLLIALSSLLSCVQGSNRNYRYGEEQSIDKSKDTAQTSAQNNILDIQNSIKVGAEITDAYFPLIKDKRIAVMSNQTGIVGDEHLVDMLVKEGLNVVGIFSPEHGFRGTADAGEHVASSVDDKTGISIWSLYGSGSGKPSASRMKEFDVLLFDLQDVGLRFYTYYISMMRLMDACAEHNKKMIVLDRPNPNGMYVMVNT